MGNKEQYGIILPGVCALLICACTGCVSAPQTVKPQFTRHNYTYSILSEPDQPNTSPQLDVSLSLCYMEYPAEQAQFFNHFLYTKAGPDAYKDSIVQEQRNTFRDRLSGSARHAADVTEGVTEDAAPERPAPWRYAETVNVKEQWPQGMLIERVNEMYDGGAHPFTIKRYYVLDMERQKHIKIDDLFADFYGEKRLRDVIYDELRHYDQLETRQSLSEGIFFSNEPELTFNFYVTKEGLALHWDPAQIAPYSAGPVEIVLPWYAIRPLMLTSGIQLLTKFDIFLFV